MDSLWRILCCGYQYRLQGDSNSLLDPNSGQDGHSLTTPLTTLNSEQYQNAVLENEGVTQQIIDTIGQLEEISAKSIQQSLTMCMECITSQHVRLYILNHMLDSLPKTSKLATLKALVAILDAKQQTELESIITGLPPSVFGDVAARENTRVLVDLVADTRDCSHIDKFRVASHKKFIDSTVEMFLQTLSSLPAGDRVCVIIGVINSQHSALKMKLTLKYLVLSRCMKPDYDSRGELVTLLFSNPNSNSNFNSNNSNSFNSNSNSNSNNTSTSSSTTTTTTTSSHNVLVQTM